jgi:tetratricopeptide (TPR) repeat protein
VSDEVQQCRERLARFPAGHPAHGSALLQLAIALHDRYEDGGARRDLGEAIAVAERAEALIRIGHPDRGRCVAVFGSALHCEHAVTHDPGLLDRAIALLAEAHATLAGQHPAQVLICDELAMLHSARYRAAGDPADLDAAIEAMTVAVRLADSDDADRPAYASNLGLWHTERFERRGRAEDARQAVTWLELAVSGTDPDEAEFPDRVEKLADALVERGRVDHTVADLDQAIQISRTVRRSGDARPLSRLDIYHLARFELTGESADLAAAVRYAEAAAEAETDPHTQLMYRMNLANRLLNRAEATGWPADLDRGVETLADMLLRLPDDHPDKAALFTNHGIALSQRYRFTGDPADLKSAAASHGRAVTYSANSVISRAEYLSNLGVARTELAELTGDAGTAGGAVEAHDEAVRLLPPGHPDRHSALSNLALGLRVRHEITGDPADLDRAITTGTEATIGLPAGHPATIRLQTTLTGALQARYLHHGDRADLDRAITAGQAALAAAPVGQPHRSTCLLNLHRAYDLRFQQTGDQADRERAVAYGKEAETDPVAPLPIRIEAAKRNGRRAASAGDWASAADSFAGLVRLLPMVTLRRATRGGQEEVLSEQVGAPFAAASCALSAGRPGDAVTVLEQGRGILWAQSLDRRSDLSLLEQRAPRLARQVRNLRARLDASPGRLSLAAEWEALLAQVAEVFEPPPFGSAAGPVVVLNVSPYRCDALIVIGHTVQVVPLPTLTQSAVLAKMRDYIDALEAEIPDEPAVSDVLEWLWDHVAEPVMSVLERTGARHVTWCPTGALALLPVHAAGYHRPEHAGQRRSVLDRMASSYTATLRAAASPGEPLGRDAGPLLFVGMPETLPGVGREREILRGHLGSNCHVMEGPAATREPVRDELTRHRAVHFSCHGRQDLDDPSAGGVILHDGVLSVADIAGARHGGEFAFLSACETAFSLSDVIDEVVTLAAALQYSGWRHVIATLWAVGDRNAAFITRLVYDRLVLDGRLHAGNAAEALHHAVHRLRDKRRNHPSAWVPFIHVGAAPG